MNPFVAFVTCSRYQIAFKWSVNFWLQLLWYRLQAKLQRRQTGSLFKLSILDWNLDTMRWKIFQRMKFLFRHSSNSRKLSRQKFDNELSCAVFTAHYTSKNAAWNEQQLTDGGILANRNSSNHPFCFLSNQKKVQILAFLHVICKRNVSCPPPESRLQR